jgi:hypothetical protein
MRRSFQHSFTASVPNRMTPNSAPANGFAVAELGVRRLSRFPVTTKHFNSDWAPKRPFRAVCITFGCLAVLFSVTTPFMDDIPNRWHFLLAGLGCSAVLAFFAIGFCLLPARIRARTLIGFFLLMAVPFAVMLAILFAIRSQLPFSSFDNLIPVALWTSIAGGVFFLSLASYGWYLRLNDSNQVA